MNANGRVMGIDLGTTYSTAAIFGDGRLWLVRDERGEVCIPSVVHRNRAGRWIVGTEALRLREQEPFNTVCGIKRLLGRDSSAGSVRLSEAASAARLAKAAGDELGVVLRERLCSAPEIAAAIFSYLRERAQQHFGRDIKKAVITLPASATPKTREATLRAAAMAGLEVVATVSEPTAAAVASGATRFSGERKFMVYDFGGGTFDVSVLEQRDLEFRVLATSGDEALGGDNFDDLLARRIAGVIWGLHRVELSRDQLRWMRVLTQSERVKRALSTRMEVQFKLEDAYSHGGRWQAIDFRIRREDVEGQWGPLISRSLAISAETLLQANLRPADLAGVVLAGGTSYVPLVRSEVTRVFDRPFAVVEDPQTVVAAGAAIIAAGGAAVGEAPTLPKAAESRRSQERLLT